MPAARSLLFSPEALDAAIEDLAARMLARPPRCGGEAHALVGIHRRGVPLARRIATAMERLSGNPVPVGTLDITQHRDDLGTLEHLPPLLGSEIPFDIDGACVTLCDEVIFTGRSIRAALTELLDFGRPSQVRLAVLVDREGREFPVQPDFSAHRIEISPHQRVSVHFTETDGEDAVYVDTPPPAAP
ncbi:MAG: bifunctional pyr operon transcriptional regulator/uracil phosphoribosyltransferase PyrR [Verrucomicrobiales bacterium]|nr:bifunctional pyr operon transcriptional regulator/uracil phosphoribosyltransferase PyrR [Verrucomicrobiales bacterium]